MSLENVGLGGVLSFDDKQAVSGMRSAGSAADKFKGQFSGIVDVAKQVGEGISNAGRAMAGFGIAGLPATAALGAGFHMAADFEHQMSGVKAVTQATGEDMVRLEKVAKHFGATTAFSATEAGGGLELLGRAGFHVDEAISAIGPVLNAASADGIDLATAADIIAGTLKGMGLEANQSARASDVLALATHKANTTMTQMGEAMRYAAPQAKTLGIDLETTTAILGALGDANLKASIGGTSFSQALIKLEKPSKDGAALLAQYHVKMTKTATGGLDVVDVFKQIHKHIAAIPDVMERAKAMTEIFGVRGEKAFSAMETAIDTGKIDRLVDSLRNAKGAAEKMANTRLDNFEGAFTKLQHEIAGFSLETAGRFLTVATESVREYTKPIRNLVLTLQELNTEEGLTGERAHEAGSTIVAIAKGIKEGLDTVIATWRHMRQLMLDTIAQFVGGQSEEMVQKVAKIATIAFVVVAAIAPITVALGGVALFISHVILPAFASIGSLVGALFSWPVLAAIGIVVGGFLLIHRQGETVKQTFQRIVDGIVSGFNWVMETAVKPFLKGFEFIPNVFDYVHEKFNDFVFSMQTNFGDIINGIMQAADALKPFFKVLFTFIGNIVGVIVQGIGLAFTTMFDVVSGLMGEVRNITLSVLESVVNFIRTLAFGLGELGTMLGLDWGKKMADWGAKDFKVQVGVERGLGSTKSPQKQITDSGLSKAEMAELQKQADADMIGMAVGDAVKGAMPDSINVESKVCVDGKTVAKATAKHKQELSERAGFKATPWQRRALVEHGGAPVGGA